ncbi:hypothetical protein A7X67_13235 [Clostridium sp. W14A]|nr:hypothetical protein A7X67_13235 [Clostridium sp. W14A]
MAGIQIQNGLVQFYGNAAGYVENGKAVVDPLFRCDELQDYLTKKQELEVQWTDGVYDRLASRSIVSSPELPATDVADSEGSVPLESEPANRLRIPRSCRIYQLKPNVDVMMKFIGYDDLLKKFGAPDPKNYSLVYDGQIETEDLDEIYEKFNVGRPSGFQGHSLSISDVIELYDEAGSSCHYVDHFGFRDIEFQTPAQQNGQRLNETI